MKSPRLLASRRLVKGEESVSRRGRARGPCSFRVSGKQRSGRNRARDERRGRRRPADPPLDDDEIDGGGAPESSHEEIPEPRHAVNAGRREQRKYDSLGERRERAG